MINKYEDKARVIAMAVVVVIMLVVLMLLQGCATYEISRCENGVCSSAKIVSPRKFKNIAFDYDRESGTFSLQASDVSTDVSAINTLAGVIMLQQQQNQQGDE